PFVSARCAGRGNGGDAAVCAVPVAGDGGSGVALGAGGGGGQTYEKGWPVAIEPASPVACGVIVSGQTIAPSGTAAVRLPSKSVCTVTPVTKPVSADETVMPTVSLMLKPWPATC